MHFYRTLMPIAAMTFDLDDTLYDNVPVMDKTEEETLAFIRQYDERFHHFTEHDVDAYKTMVIVKLKHSKVLMKLWLILLIGVAVLMSLIIPIKC